MEHFDIEAYLDGELRGAKLEAFEAEMRSNPAFTKEVELMRQLTKDIEVQGVREEVKKILKEDTPSRNDKKGLWFGMFLGIAVVALVAYFLKPEEDASISAPVLQQQKMAPSTESNEQEDGEVEKKEIESDIEEDKTPPSEKQRKKKAPGPIAQNPSANPLSAPLHPSPNVRGQSNDNKEWKALLDQLWYTSFPPANTTINAPFDEAAQLLGQRNFTKAFVKLEILERKIPQNDTLNYLKAYCLMEMGEGKDALRYFDQLEESHPDWQAELQWYRGLSQLLFGGSKDAIPVFKNIVATPDHPFKQQSQKALELLK